MLVSQIAVSDSVRTWSAISQNPQVPEAGGTFNPSIQNDTQKRCKNDLLNLTPSTKMCYVALVHSPSQVRGAAKDQGQVALPLQRRYAWLCHCEAEHTWQTNSANYSTCKTAHIMLSFPLKQPSLLPILSAWLLNLPNKQSDFTNSGAILSQAKWSWSPEPTSSWKLEYYPMFSLAKSRAIISQHFSKLLKEVFVRQSRMSLRKESWTAELSGFLGVWWLKMIEARMILHGSVLNHPQHTLSATRHQGDSLWLRGVWDLQVPSHHHETWVFDNFKRQKDPTPKPNIKWKVSVQTSAKNEKFRFDPKSHDSVFHIQSESRHSRLSQMGQS